jgi:hypothetical protein
MTKVGPRCESFQERVFVYFVTFSTDPNKLTLPNPLMLLVLHKTVKMYGGLEAKLQSFLT